MTDSSTWLTWNLLYKTKNSFYIYFSLLPIATMKSTLVKVRVDIRQIRWVTHLLFPNHHPGQFFGRPERKDQQVRSYFLYLPLKETRNLIKFTSKKWRRRRKLISDPGGCLRSGTIGMSTASLLTSFIDEILDRRRKFDVHKITLFHSSRVKVRPILINIQSTRLRHD